MSYDAPWRQALGTVVVAAALIAAHPASATSISYKAWYSAANGPDPGTAPQTFTQTDWGGVSQKIQVPKFDTALGTLTAATLVLYADANSTGSVSNPGPGSVAVKSYVASVRLHLLTPSNNASGPGIDAPAASSTPFLLEALPPLITITNQSIAAGASLPFSQSGASNSSGVLDLFAASGVLPFFEGVGPASLGIFTDTKTVSSITGGKLVVNQSTAARAEAVVSYTYTPAPPPVPVPEPMSIGILGVSLVGLGLVRRWI